MLTPGWCQPRVQARGHSRRRARADDEQRSMPGVIGAGDDDKDEVVGQRVFGCELVQQMGILLRMPQVVTSTAQVMFHRFYAKRSLYKFDARVS